MNNSEGNTDIILPFPKRSLKRKPLLINSQEFIGWPKMHPYLLFQVNYTISRETRVKPTDMPDGNKIMKSSQELSKWYYSNTEKKPYNVCLL